jgi:O-antigen ligase
MLEAYFKFFQETVLEENLGGLGLGLSSFEAVGPLIKVGDLNYLFMHNDFAQIFFETGAVGFTYLILASGAYVWSARKNTQLLVTTISILILMITYFPSHFFLSQLLIFLTISQIHAERGHT